MTNVVSGDIVQGGSTITQQLVKKRILSDKRDVHRKVREIILALRLNEKFSKDKILDRVPQHRLLRRELLRHQVGGAALLHHRRIPRARSGSAARRWTELTIGEAALLAGSINNPVGNDPFIHPEKAKVRRAEVLKAEVEEGYITQAEADAANLEPLPDARAAPELRPCNYLVAEVRDQLLADQRLGATPEERREKLLTRWPEDRRPRSTRGCRHSPRTPPTTPSRRRDPTGSRRSCRSNRPPAR